MASGWRGGGLAVFQPVATCGGQLCPFLKDKLGRRSRGAWGCPWGLWGAARTFWGRRRRRGARGEGDRMGGDMNWEDEREEYNTKSPHTKQGHN